jgi:hypothetical protein
MIKNEKNAAKVIPMIYLAVNKRERIIAISKARNTNTSIDKNFVSHD